MNFLERYQKPTPRFFKNLRNKGVALASIGGTLLAAPVELPELLLRAGAYAVVAGTVLVAVSQAVVTDEGA